MVMFQFVAVFAATLFTGAAAYINVAEDPARMECGTVLASTVFGPSHRRAALMQVLLAVIATIAGVGAWFAGGGPNWLVGSLLILLLFPFTLVVIRPTNFSIPRSIAARIVRAVCCKGGAGFTVCGPF